MFLPMTDQPPASWVSWTAANAGRVIACAALIGLILRLGFGLGYWVGKPLTHDEREYLSLARNIALGQGFVYDPPPQPEDGALPPERFGRAPLYPAFLAVAARSDLLATDDWSETPTSVTVAQSIVGTIAIVFIALIAWRAAGPLAGAGAAGIAAVYPPLVWICAYVLSESLYSVLALGSAWLLGLATDRWPPPDQGRQRRWTYFAGVVAGFATLTRPAMLAFLALTGGWLLLRRHASLVLAFSVGAALVILPWTARNLLEHGRLVLVASEGGITFWTGNHPLARGEGDMAANPAIKLANLELRARYPHLGPEELEPIYYREAFSHIADDPLRWVGLLARKFFYLWVPIGPSYTLHSTRYLVASLVSYGLVLPLAIAGFVLLRRSLAPPRALWLLFGSAVLVSVVFFPQERFRIPVIDPTLIICAGAWLGLKRPRTAAAPQPVSL